MYLGLLFFFYAYLREDGLVGRTRATAVMEMSSAIWSRLPEHHLDRILALLPHSLLPPLPPSIFSNLHLKKTRNLLPSTALPIIDNLHQLGPYLHSSFHSLSRKYGPILLLYLRSIPAIVISSADLAEQVMKTQDLTFSTRPPSSIPNRLFYNYRDIAFARYGEHWWQMKKICVVHLVSVNMVQSFRSVTDEEASFLLSSIKATSPSPVNLSKMIMVQRRRRRWVSRNVKGSFSVAWFFSHSCLCWRWLLPACGCFICLMFF